VLATFLVEAHRNTYADKTAAKASSSRLKSSDYCFERSGLVYHDTYFGRRDFVGEEIIYRDDAPVWGMNYYGVVLADDVPAGEVFDFLREALMQDCTASSRRAARSSTIAAAGPTTTPSTASSTTSAAWKRSVGSAGWSTVAASTVGGSGDAAVQTISMELLLVGLRNRGPGQRLQQRAVRQGSLSALADSRRQDLLHTLQVGDPAANVFQVFQGQRVDRPAGTRLFGGEGEKTPDFVE
jgi:hypothetical protein